MRSASIFVIWRAYQGRVDSMRRAFGFEPVFMGSASSRRFLRPLEYCVKGFQTLWILLRRRPRIVWMQLPPTPLLYVVALVKAVRPGLFTIADCHNGVVVGPWRRTPFLVKIFNSVIDLVLVHNDYVHGEALAMGIRRERCLVLEDAPGEMGSSGESSRAGREFARPWMLFPAGFDRDEPIRELLDAAARLPRITFVITGEASRARGRHEISNLPHNVVLAGWVDAPSYKRLFQSADLVLALTNVEGVALSVAAEAVGARKAAVMSDTRILRALYPRGAVHVSTTGQAIAAGILQALARKEQLEAEMHEFRRERAGTWRRQAAEVKRRLPAARRVVAPPPSRSAAL